MHCKRPVIYCNNSLHTETTEDDSSLHQSSSAPVAISSPLLSYTVNATGNNPDPSAFSIDYKNDILTQSQILKSDDNAQFLASQTPEINTLLQNYVMDVHPMANLPPNAELLSSIRSYQHKWSPQGMLLKHKARIFTNGKQFSLVVVLSLGPANYKFYFLQQPETSCHYKSSSLT
jgi:hypothetical protein